MKSLLVFLLTVSAAAGQSFFGGATLTLPRTASVISVSGTLTLTGPADSLTLRATAVSVFGTLALPVAGNYTIEATTLSVSGGISGPASGTAYVRLAGVRTIFGTVAANVRILGEGEPFPPAAPVTPPPVPTIPLPAPGGGAAPLVNISTRATLAAGAALTPGFVVGGTAPRRVLVRAVGPGLAAFGVGAPISAPVLAIFRGTEEIARNAGWAAELAPVFAAVGAFVLAPGSRDAALLLTLAPGAYTARIDGGAGEVLAEVYFVD